MKKICKKCNEEKELEQFCNKKDNPDGKHIYCRICKKKDNDKWYEDTKIERKDYYVNQRKINQQYHIDYCKEHYQNNKEQYRKWNKDKYDTDLTFRIKHIIAARLNVALRNYSPNLKQNNTIEYLGCSLSNYVTYLESKFKPKMTWLNYGTVWEIDHIKPIDSFDLNISEELYKCFHYTNTQPLIKTENRQKSNKIVV